LLNEIKGNVRYLDIDELKTLYELLQFQYISYENEPAILLMRKIRDIIESETYEIPEGQQPN